MAALARLQAFDYNKAINYLLIGYAFSLPLSKAGVNFFEILILLLWIIQANWKAKFELYKSSHLIIGLTLLMLLHIISIAWASSTEFALNYIAKFRHFFIILVIYSSLDKEHIKSILSAFLTGMFLSEIMSYGIFFELWHYKNILPTDPSPFMNHVDYSIYLAFTSVLLLTRLLNKTETSIKLKIGYALFFISATSNLFINGGRTGQITLPILLYIGIILSFKNKLKAFISSTLLIITIFLLAYNFSPNFQQRFQQANDGIQKMIYNNEYQSDGFTQRVALWYIGIDNFKDHFFFGNGLGNDTKKIKFYAENRGFDPEFFSQFADNHNMFLIVVLQIGIVGLVLILFIFYTIFRLKFNFKMHKILNLTFIVGFFLWSFGGSTFHLMNSMVFFALFAGLFNKLSQIEQSNKFKGTI